MNSLFRVGNYGPNRPGGPLNVRERLAALERERLKSANLEGSEGLEAFPIEGGGIEESGSLGGGSLQPSTGLGNVQFGNPDRTRLRKSAAAPGALKVHDSSRILVDDTGSGSNPRTWKVAVSVTVENDTGKAWSVTARWVDIGGERSVTIGTMLAESLLSNTYSFSAEVSVPAFTNPFIIATSLSGEPEIVTLAGSADA